MYYTFIFFKIHFYTIFLIIWKSRSVCKVPRCFNPKLFKIHELSVISKMSRNPLFPSNIFFSTMRLKRDSMHCNWVQYFLMFYFYEWRDFKEVSVWTLATQWKLRAISGNYCTLCRFWVDKSDFWTLLNNFKGFFKMIFQKTNKILFWTS